MKTTLKSNAWFGRYKLFKSIQGRPPTLRFVRYLTLAPDAFTLVVVVVGGGGEDTPTNPKSKRDRKTQKRRSIQ